MAPQLIFGSAAFGMDLTDFQDAQSVSNLFRTLKDLGIHRLDSAARYPPLKPGRTEELIGETSELSKDFTIDTKIYTDVKTDSNGDLSFQSIEKSVQSSLKQLQRPGGVNVLYIHRADHATPLEEQVEAFNQQIKKGHCRAWGVSNVSPEMLEKMLRICDEKGLQKPSCYQGEYNLVTRGMETKLLPILRAHGMTYNAFRGLAGGFLTGNFINGDVAGTRFSDEDPLGIHMRRMFGAEDLHSAMTKFDQGVRARGLTPVEVAIRWLGHHSALGRDDGIILGASKQRQVTETVGMIRKGPLPEDVLSLTEDLWGTLEESRGNII